jgi:hypothetical protein
MTTLTSKEIYETGSEAEFVVTGIAKYEIIGKDMLRLYLASARAGHLRLEYTAVTSCADLLEMARMCMHIVAAAHNQATLVPAGETAH